MNKGCQYADSFFSSADKAFIRRFNAHVNRIELTAFLSVIFWEMGNEWSVKCAIIDL